MSGSEANSSIFISALRSHRDRHTAGTSDRHTPLPGRFGPVCSGPPRHRSPAGAARCASGKGVRGPAESTIMGRIPEARARGAARGNGIGKCCGIRGRDVEAPRLRHVRHSHSTMTHSAHHTHTRHSSRAPPALISDARCTRRHGTHKRQHSRAAYGLWGSPSPPAAQSTFHEAHQPPNLSSSTASAAHATPYLPIMDASHHVDVAPRTPCRQPRAPPRSHTLHTHAQVKKGGRPHRLVSLRHFVHFVTSACRITWSAMNLLHRRMPTATALADFAMPRCPFTRGVHSRRARCALRRPATASVAGGERHQQLLVTDHLPVDYLDSVTRRQARVEDDARRAGRRVRIAERDVAVA